MPVRSLNSSVLKWPSREIVDRAVRSWASAQARHRPQVRRLGYFGSYARDDWGVGSDLDLIAVVDETSQPFERRALNWELNDLPVPAEMVIYTAQEWENLQNTDNRFGRMLRSEVVWTYLRDE
jgi:predicted nucleotidyltransferase